MNLSRIYSFKPDISNKCKSDGILEMTRMCSDVFLALTRIVRRHCCQRMATSGVPYMIFRKNSLKCCIPTVHIRVTKILLKYICWIPLIIIIAATDVEN